MNIYFSISILIALITLILLFYFPKYLIKHSPKYLKYKHNIFIYLFWIMSLVCIVLINKNTIEHLDQNKRPTFGICTKDVDGITTFGIYSTEYGKCIVDPKIMDYIQKLQKETNSKRKQSATDKSKTKQTKQTKQAKQAKEITATDEINILNKYINDKPGLITDTNCYDSSKTDFQEKCNIEVGKLYGLKYKTNINCDKNKMRGVCDMNYMNGHKIPEGDVTKCLPVTSDFNYICKDLFTDQHSIKSIDYKTCHKGFARGVCATNYKDEVPLYGVSTACFKWNTNFQNECKKKYGNDYIISNKDGLNCVPSYGRGVCSKIYRNINLDGKIIEIYNKYKCPLYLDENSATFGCEYYPSKIIATKVNNNYTLSAYINDRIYYIYIDRIKATYQITVKSDISIDMNCLFDITRNSNYTYNIANIDERGNYCYIDGVNNKISCNKSDEYTELIIKIIA